MNACMYSARHGKLNLFPQKYTKEYCGWLCTQMWMAEQQITEFPCVAVYEAHHYRGFTVHIRVT